MLAARAAIAASASLRLSGSSGLTGGMRRLTLLLLLHNLCLLARRLRLGRTPATLQR